MNPLCFYLQTRTGAVCHPLISSGMLSLLVHTVFLILWVGSISLDEMGRPAGEVQVTFRRSLPAAPESTIQKNSANSQNLLFNVPQKTLTQARVFQQETTAKQPIPSSATSVDAANSFSASNSSPLTETTDGESVEINDRDALKEFIFALGRQSRRFKEYPTLARQRGWDGIVKLSVTAKFGQLFVAVKESSGHDLLDQQALLMLENAIRQNPLPNVLRQRQFQFLVPIEYNLNSGA